jgi:hypothetical protein
VRIRPAWGSSRRVVSVRSARERARTRWLGGGLVTVERPVVDEFVGAA